MNRYVSNVVKRVVFGFTSFVLVLSTVTAVVPIFLTQTARAIDLPVQTCSASSTVLSTSLSAWNLTQTRATGHNELVPGGLRIWTEGATSTDKAAGYYATNFSLSNLSDRTIAQSIDYVSTLGPTAPGLQLVVDFNGDGSPDGILVGEAVYGNGWWLSNSAKQFVKDNTPNNGGGYGSLYYGTPNEWINKFPNAIVKAIGYSLGSGVHGDGVIKKISIGCVNYTFDIAHLIDTISPTILNVKITNPSLWGDNYNILNIPNHLSTATNLPTIGGKVNVSADFSDDVLLTNAVALLPGRGFFFKDSSWSGITPGTRTVAWNTNGATDWSKVPDGSYEFELQAGDGGNGQNQLQNFTDKSILVTVDNTAPVPEFTGSTPAENATVRGTITVEGNFTDANGLMNTDIGVHNDGRIGQGWKCHTDWPTVGIQVCSIDTTVLSNGLQKLTMNVRDKAGNTTQVFRTINVQNPTPTVVGENFNTNSDAGYKGLNVGFNIANFKTVTGVSVALYGVDGNLLVTNTDNQKLLDLIKAGTTEVSTPFITNPGTYVEEYWNLGTHKWLATDKPTKAIVTVTGTDNTGALVAVNTELAQLVEPNGWTFASILPVVVALPITTTPTTQVTPVTPIVGAAPYATTSVTAAAVTTAPAGEVLGASTTKADAPAVAGAETSKDVAAEPAAKDGFNSAWYWLLTIPVAGAAWWALAAFRHRES